MDRRIPGLVLGTLAYGKESAKGRTVKLPQGASKVAPGCMVGGGSCAHRDHRAAKALPLRRPPCPATGKLVRAHITDWALTPLRVILAAHESAPGCMVGGRSCAHIDRTAAKALSLR